MEQPLILQQKISLWQILFYLSMGVVLLWFILKISGVIQTPWWLEFGAPMGGLFLGIFTMYHNLMKAINKLGIGLATLTVKVEHLSTDVQTLKHDMIVVKQDIGIVKKKLRLS